ncbi:MAG: serine/threonine-protein kinase [Ignavibacteriales bacterium]|nr:serine/threonine-protein kinase [Ignavibacteriales bacterium]
MIGQSILQYKILEKVGEGGMGVVYKAQDTKLDRFVALKFLTKNVGASESDRQRFMQEAKAAATLNHPNICTIYDVAEHEGQLFIAMEFIDGETLRDRKNNISFKQSIDIGIQVAEALAAAHDKGIVHRDIKPENVMLRKDGLVQIMDFGLAKLQGVSRLTREGNTVGTMGYMSPEQVQGFNVDHRTDIFSFGVLLYELLSGQSPFKGMHETAIIYEIVNVDPEPISIVKPDLPPDLDAILLECLAKEPDERYQSAKEIVKDLRKLKRESSRQTASRILAVRKSQIASGSRMAPQTTEYETIPQKKSLAFDTWKIGAGLSTLLLIVSVVWYFLYGTTEPELIRLSFEAPGGNIFNSTNGGHLEISPDGTMVAFVAGDSLGRDHLWVRPLDSPAPLQIPGTENAYYPFWSYDSKMIGYFADGKLKKVDAKGGPSFTICDAPSGRGGTWNSEGVIVFAPNSGGPLHQVSAAGGTSKQLTVLDSTEFEVNHRWPFFLPDGDHFFYSVQTSKPSLEDDADHIRITSLSGGTNTIVIRASSNVSYNEGWVMYYKQNTLLAQRFDEGSLTLAGEPIPVIENVLYSRVRSKGTFSQSRSNRLSYLSTSKSDQEMVIYNSSGVIQHRMKSKVSETYATFSRDEKYIATDALDESAKNTDLWIHDIQRMSDTRLTFDKGTEIVPEWSPDGKKIYFSSNRSGVFSVYAKNSNGTGDDQLVYSQQSHSYVTDVSADGNKILLSINSQGPQKWDIGMFDIVQKKYTPLLTSDFSEWVAVFSPDGKWYAYQSNETGKYEIYIRPTDGSPSKWQVSTNGGAAPQWLNNGKEIMYNVADQQIYSVSVAVSGNQITVGQSKLLFKVDAGFQSEILGTSKSGKKILAKRTLNTQSLKSASLIFNWKNLVEKK